MKIEVKEQSRRTSLIVYEGGSRLCTLTESNKAGGGISVQHNQNPYNCRILDAQTAELLLTLLGYRLDPDLGFVKIREGAE